MFYVLTLFLILLFLIPYIHIKEKYSPIIGMYEIEQQRLARDESNMVVSGSLVDELLDQKKVSAIMEETAEQTKYPDIDRPVQPKENETNWSNKFIHTVGDQNSYISGTNYFNISETGINAMINNISMTDEEQDALEEQKNVPFGHRGIEDELRYTCFGFNGQQYSRFKSHKECEKTTDYTGRRLNMRERRVWDAPCQEDTDCPFYSLEMDTNLKKINAKFNNAKNNMVNLLNESKGLFPTQMEQIAFIRDKLKERGVSIKNKTMNTEFIQTLKNVLTNDTMTEGIDELNKYIDEQQDKVNQYIDTPVQGGCDRMTGQCIMPKGVRRIGYRYYDPSPKYAPICRNCQSRYKKDNFEGTCCTLQAKGEKGDGYNYVLYTKGNPDYVFE